MTVKAFCKRLLRLAKTDNQQEKQPTTTRAFTVRYRSYRRSATLEERLLLQVKCIALFLLASSFVASANNGFTQDISINRENVSIQTVFKEIERQSDYRFFYNESLLQQASKVTVQVQHVSLEEALNACFKNQPLWYNIIEKTIIIKRREIAQPVVKTQVPKKLPLVKGLIEDSKGPVAGATVTVVETKEVTTTNAVGAFSFTDLEETSTLSISSVSHLPVEIKLAGRSSLSISLQEKVNTLDESVIVAYNITTQRKATGSFSIVKGQQIQSLPNRSFDKSLQGLVPGLFITKGDGQPGSAPSNFVLRGIATAVDPINDFNSVRNPLIVIDGVPVSQDLVRLTTSGTHGNPLAQINPSDIETITVLKDASAVSLYGSRASNGVILVTTKRGKSGKTTFTFRHQTDIASQLKGKFEVLNQDEYLDLLYEAYKNYDPALTDADILADLQSKFPTKANGDFYPAPDWYSELFKEQAATFSNELALSGGNEKSNFYLNLEYTKQNGVLKKSGYDRKAIRFNFENKITEKLKIGLNSAFSYNLQDYFNGGGHVPSFLSPLNPVRLEDGSYALHYPWGGTFDPEPNPAAMSEYNSYQNTSFRGLIKLYGELTFLKYFKLSSSLGTDFMLTEAKEKADPRLLDYTSFSVGTGSISERDIRRANIITTNLLRFDKTYKSDHTLGILLGHEAQILNQKDLFLQVSNLGLTYFDQLSSNPGATITGAPWSGGVRAKETLLSIFGQINYSYQNKYFLTSTLRRDGSSRFGDDRKFGTYWSTGAGWIITSEPFMKKSSSWLNYLKLRGSVGSAGYAGAINAFTRLDRLNNSIYQGNTAVFQEATPANPNVQWEETFTWDAGLETKFFNDRLAFTADIYNRKTSDVLYKISLPLSSGFSNILANIGQIENKGVELSLSADIFRRKNFRWNLNVNWSTNQNKLIKADVPATYTSLGMLGNKEGENFNSFFLVRWAGVNVDDGLPQWLDLAGNVTSSYPFDVASKKFVGKPQPDGFGGITNTIVFQNIELAAMFYYQYGFQIYDGLSYMLDDGNSGYLNQSKEALNRWQKQGDKVKNPRRVLNNYDGGHYPSTRYLYDGDYIRLQNVALAYNFPKRILDRLHLNMLKLFIQGNNLAIWTKYPGRDPEDTSVYGSIQSTYPNQKSFSIGLNATF